MGTRLYSVNTAVKRANLRALWNALPAANSPALIDALSDAQAAALAITSTGQNVLQTASNGHSATLEASGYGMAAPQELLEMWGDLVDRASRATVFLKLCAQQGLDAYQKIALSHDMISPQTPVSNPVILDNLGQWNLACLTYEIDPAIVVNQPVTDNALYVWLMDHLQAVRAGSGDFGDVRIAGGLQYA